MNEVTLNNGVKIPQIGFGTAAIGNWQQDDDHVKNVILGAIEAGYRYIDTASLYGNERSVGRAVNESSIAREEFFVTSKNGIYNKTALLFPMPKAQTTLLITYCWVDLN